MGVCREFLSQFPANQTLTAFSCFLLSLFLLISAATVWWSKKFQKTFKTKIIRLYICCTFGPLISNSSISSSQLWCDLSLQILSWIYVVRLPMPAVSLTIYHFTVLQVLSAATIVAKHTSALCNACRLASSKTTNPVAKRHFVQSAKEVANSTANLVKTIKVGFYLVKSLTLWPSCHCTAITLA